MWEGGGSVIVRALGGAPAGCDDSLRGELQSAFARFCLFVILHLHTNEWAAPHLQNRRLFLVGLVLTLVGLAPSNLLLILFGIAKFGSILTTVQTNTLLTRVLVRLRIVII